MSFVDTNHWIWMRHPAHFIGASECQFIMATYVGKYIVSTVGEWKSSSGGGKFQKIGSDRLYETMVFKAKKRRGRGKLCCPYEIVVEKHIDARGYNDAAAAYKGHMELCTKYSNPIKN